MNPHSEWQTPIGKEKPSGTRKSHNKPVHHAVGANPHPWDKETESEKKIREREEGK